MVDRMTETQTSGTDAHTLAEIRLGRPLTLGERAVDIVGVDQDLAKGKARLAAAVEKEKRRAVNAWMRYRRPIRLDVTPEMLAALRALHRAGRKHAKRQVRELTGKRFAEYAQRGDPLARIERKLKKELNRYEDKISGRAADATVELDMGEIASDAAARAVLQMPGALAVAAEIVSGAMFSGMGSVYDEAAGLFSAWTYSAVMDGATCDPCSQEDGNEFASWEEIQLVLPDGGPNPDCDGEGRCRCMAVPNA